MKDLQEQQHVDNWNLISMLKMVSWWVVNALIVELSESATVTCRCKMQDSQISADHELDT